MPDFFERLPPEDANWLAKVVDKLPSEGQGRMMAPETRTRPPSDFNLMGGLLKELSAEEMQEIKEELLASILDKLLAKPPGMRMPPSSDFNLAGPIPNMLSSELMAERKSGLLTAVRDKSPMKAPETRARPSSDFNLVGGILKELSANLRFGKQISEEGASYVTYHIEKIEVVVGDKKEVVMETRHTSSGDVIGGDRIVHGNEVHGDVVGGDKITTGDVSGIASIGRGSRVTAGQGLSSADVEAIFVPLMAALGEVPSDQQGQATEMAETLKQEVAKGKEADDGRMAKLIDDLVGLVPSAVSAVAGVFASPILGGIAGPVTEYVLKRIRGE